MSNRQASWKQLLEEAHQEMREPESIPDPQLDIPRELAGVTRFIRAEGDQRARFNHARDVLSRMFNRALAVSVVETTQGSDEGYEYTQNEVCIQIAGAAHPYLLWSDNPYWTNGPQTLALAPFALTMRTVDGVEVVKHLPYSNDDDDLAQCPEVLRRFYHEFQAVRDCVEEMAATDPDQVLARGQVISVLPEGLKLPVEVPVLMAP